MSKSVLYENETGPDDFLSWIEEVDNDLVAKQIAFTNNYLTVRENWKTVNSAGIKFMAEVPPVLEEVKGLMPEVLKIYREGSGFLKIKPWGSFVRLNSETGGIDFLLQNPNAK